MKVFAHRGYHVSSIENTLEAFDEAVALGVDGLETDIRLTQDEVPILHHNRYIQDGRLISSLMASELDNSVGYHVPTLEEAISQSWNIVWNLEVKERAAVAPIVRVLKNFSGKRRLLITSFIHSIVIETTELLDAEGGFLVAHSPLTIQGCCTRQAKITTLVFDFDALTRHNVEETKVQGWKCAVYGALFSEEFDKLGEYGVDVVITDTPMLALNRERNQ